jgi:endoglycosylceramidase
MKRRTFMCGVVAGLAARAYPSGAPVFSAPADSKQRWLTDAGGRQLLPHGFVTLTGDAAGVIRYKLEDYERMAALGANFQVIRIFLGKVGGWPGYKLDEAYIEQVGQMITLGRQAGMQTFLKLAVYDIAPFGKEQWQRFWTDLAVQELLVRAWRAIFEHFKDEPALLGYDLVNEPIRGDIESNEVFVRDHLVPCYRKLIDVLHEISPEKWALYQPPYEPPYIASPTPGRIPFGRMEIPIERTKIAYSPHCYGQDPAAFVKRYLTEAELSEAALFIGEHGNIIPESLDGNLDYQWAYQKVLIATVSEFDRHALGAIKPWFCGTRFRLGRGKATWALLRGKSGASGPERKFVMDVLARPVPLVMAGQVRSYSFNFATREFEMDFVPDSSKGASEIYVPLERHFPDGFRLIYSRGLTLAYDPFSEIPGLRVVQNANQLDASNFQLQPARGRILVTEWDKGTGEATLKIVPGVRD